MQTDFSDMKNYCYSFKTESVLRVNKMNIFQILSRMYNMISDTNDIFNSFLKIMSTLFAKIIIILTQTFWNVFYYLKWFWTVCIIILYKSEKSNYIILRIWKLIILLSTIKKIIEIMTATHLKQMMKAHNMLLKQQIREHQNCFTKTALNLLIN